ncbi:MAG: GNAT superfamily N-acetyltransferase [Planctomycetota bacterium]|jgi:GNAT superfamily N-acetyltransferase
MKLILLADKPEAAPILAQWYFDEWAKEVTGMTLEKVLSKVQTFTERLIAPLSVLALEGDEVVGAAEFKIREMDIFPDYEFWLGGVYVRADKRGQGIASLLVAEVIRRARVAGTKHLYLQTEDLTGGLYAQHGFQPLREVTHDGHRVLVMTAALA